MSDFTSRFKEAFEASGLSQAELGRRSGIARGNIHDYLIGRMIPKRNRVESIAQVLHVNPDWLAGANVSKDGIELVQLDTAKNLYLDNQLVTDDEQTSLVNFLRGYRAAKQQVNKK